MLAFLKRLRGEPAASLESQTRGELASIGLPHETLETDPQIARYGLYGKTVLLLAWEQVNEGQLGDAINNASVLINDPNLQRHPRYQVILAGAHYVRGSAYEQREEFTRARANFQAALKLQPDYEWAKRALTRLASK